LLLPLLRAMLLLQVHNVAHDHLLEPQLVKRLS